SLVERREPMPWLSCRVRRADGAQVWVAFTGRPILSESREFLGYYGAGRDVSDRESTIELLRQSEERFRALTALATEWYWETDADLRIPHLHQPPEPQRRRQTLALGMSLRSLSEDPNYRFDRELIDSYLARRQPFRRLPYRIQRNGSATEYYESSAEPVY